MRSKLKLQPIRQELIGREGRRHEFSGVKLGASTSRVETHTDHAGEFAPRGVKCSACRWFEVGIYRRYTPQVTMRRGSTTITEPQVKDYVVQTVGASDVPGEKRFSRVQYTSSPFSVVELLVVRPVDREPFIAPQSALALAEAAEVDAGIREAYINRAVV